MRRVQTVNRVELWHVTDKVRVRIVDGSAVLLDIDGGNYFVFDGVETAMWVAITTLPVDDRIPFIAKRFDVTSDLIRADLAEFERSCVARGFLAARPTKFTEQRRPGRNATASAATAWICMARVSLALRKSFGVAYRECLSLPKPTADPFPDVLERAENSFLRAENLFVHRKGAHDCLPRSLALFRFLTRAGIRADHIIGVKRYPFEAHAWVESRGSVLLDRPDWVRKHVELARI